MSHDFPDQPYLDRIRAALWRRGAHGQAAVMVGAGMSLNAQPRGAGSGRFPTWSDLARTVVDHLYPSYGGTNSEHRKQALRQVNATSGFLRLAQEYGTAFGREPLERLIADAVPDLRFEPGLLHQRLLELPWSDVFTTNWDTLLERAATRVVDRRYDVVRTASDIPASARPRIVKLHGTLPSIRPLIFTEDDFRTYPVHFAPFVNLTQQSMMENVFCLLGFAGDDPNFLYWSGWVRDHLGDYAPRIYLVGWLDLPPPRRRMLEDRGVVPVDLAQLSLPVPWPEETRHQRALEWFLWSLEKAEPYRETDWPEAPDPRALNPPAYLPPVHVDQTGFPRREDAGPEHSPNIDELWSTVEVWRHNRQIYPGWVIAPQLARLRLWLFTKQWIPTVLELLPTLDPIERIAVLEELNWRLETCLVPLSTELVTAISEALSTVDPLAPPNLSSDPELAGRREQNLPRRWVRLAAALLRAAREADDGPTFEHWAEALTPYPPAYAWLGPRLAYERCLLALARLDHAAVERALDALDTGAEDVFWKVRKAGILAELGKTAESFCLAGEALPEIRRQIGHGVPDIPTLSREGWAMVLAEGFRFHLYPREPVGQVESAPTRPRGLEPRDRTVRRWAVLRRHGCDAREDFYETWRAIENELPGLEPNVVEGFGFDPWVRTRIERWSSNGSGWEHLPGLQAKRLVEEAGIPPIIGHVDLAQRLLLRAAARLEEHAPGPALGTILRVSTYEKNKSFDEFFNRSRVALLADSQVNALVERVVRALDYAVPRAAAALIEEDHERTTYWIGKTCVTVEVLSRLVLRLDGDKAERILNRALDFYNRPIFRQDHRLIDPLSNLCSRTLRALSLERIGVWLGQLLALPLPDEGDFQPAMLDKWPDPFHLAASRFGTPPELPSETDWDQAIDRLITTAASHPFQPYPRWPAIERLAILLRWGILTEEQRERFGEAVWCHQPPHGGFPDAPWMDPGADFVFLRLPCPELGLAERLFRERYLMAMAVPQPQLPPETFFRNLLGAAESQEQGDTGLALLPPEVEQILERVLVGWRSGQLRRAVEEPHAWRSVFDLEAYREAFAKALGRVILPRLGLGSARVDETAEMIADLRSLEFPVEATYPALARLRPDLLPELSDRLRQSLVSSRREQAEAAVKAVWWWLREGERFDLGEPSPDLIREIATVVSMRRPSLQWALCAAEWMLRNGVLVEADRFAQRVAEGLGYLLSEAHYEAGLARQPAFSLKPNEIAEIRTLCVKLALALKHAGFGDLHSVAQWIHEGQVDPFPEVRHALGAGGDVVSGFV